LTIELPRTHLANRAANGLTIGRAAQSRSRQINHNPSWIKDHLCRGLHGSIGGENELILPPVKPPRLQLSGLGWDGQNQGTRNPKTHWN
jgi:hypothetical protein